MFHDRTDAGRQLAKRLARFESENVVVVGLPRGGVPVAFEVAHALGAPLDVILVRKLGVPFQPELAMGAIGENGVRVLNSTVIQTSGLTAEEVATVEQRERIELERRASEYRADRLRIPLAGRVVVVVDDGIATGSTAKAACLVARAEGASRVILAVPVAPADWTDRMAGSADELISLSTPRHFAGVGQFYDRFNQTTDEEVVEYLDRAAAMHSLAAASSDGQHKAQARDEDVQIRIDHERLGGHLTIPAHARSVVVFAHGSGSSRHSPRNRFVASVLNRAGLATLLFDLLSTEEEGDRANVFDVDLLGERLMRVTELVQKDPDLRGLPVGYFGASTGAAAALRAAAAPSATVTSVVSRGGRPDLAGSCVADVQAATLFIVGSRDPIVLKLNKEAQSEMDCPTRLEVIPGATHLFEEPGTLEKAAELARDWFLSQSGPSPADPGRAPKVSNH